ncbi:MAG: efflux RND transporter permease subunit, partial [bacterium]|nr:efflux RND transporter permease subunit [bacterium]
MTDIFYRNPRLLILTIGLVIVAGLAALQTLPRQEDPAMARRFGNVTTNYPGASAKRVESLITEKIEAELRKLHEIDEISSFSRSGVSMVNIDLADEYSEDDVDVVWSKVRDRIADVAERLPSGAGAPELEDGTSTALSLLVGLTWTQDGEPNLAILNRLAKELESRLRNVAYTRETKILGGAEEEIRVTIDPLALASIGLTAQEVSSRITTADSKVPAGQLRGTTNDLVIEISGELRTVDRIRSIPLRRSSDGRLLNVGDVARVEKTVREPAESIALLGGRRGIAISATMQDAHRVDLWAE